MDDKEFKKLNKEFKLKVKEYELLCAKLEELKRKKINPNDPLLLKLKEAFVKNNEEIKQIEEKLKKFNDENDKK